MKRATLSVYPSPLPSQPADLTDRLLQPEGAASKKQADKPRRGQAVRGQPRARRGAHEFAIAAPPPAEPETRPAPNTLEIALAAVSSAAEALQNAGREAPARYDVALRYRLDALAHHLQQVKEFVESLSAR